MIYFLLQYGMSNVRKNVLNLLYEGSKILCGGSVKSILTEYSLRAKCTDKTADNAKDNLSLSEKDVLGFIFG